MQSFRISNLKSRPTLHVGHPLVVSTNISGGLEPRLIILDFACLADLKKQKSGMKSLGLRLYLLQLC